MPCKIRAPFSHQLGSRNGLESVAAAGLASVLVHVFGGACKAAGAGSKAPLAHLPSRCNRCPHSSAQGTQVWY